MKNKKWFCLVMGILLMFFSLDFIIRNLNVLKNPATLIPILISIIYLVVGLNILPLKKATHILVEVVFLPLVFVLMIMLNEYIENSNSLKESFWYSHYGPFSQAEGFVNAVPYFIVGVLELVFIFTRIFFLL